MRAGVRPPREPSYPSNTTRARNRAKPEASPAGLRPKASAEPRRARWCLEAWPAAGGRGARVERGTDSHRSAGKARASVRSEARPCPARRQRGSRFRLAGRLGPEVRRAAAPRFRCGTAGQLVGSTCEGGTRLHSALLIRRPHERAQASRTGRKSFHSPQAEAATRAGSPTAEADGRRLGLERGHGHPSQRGQSEGLSWTGRCDAR
jgi:hypothetical protein